MKKIIILLSLLLSVVVSYGQDRSGEYGREDPRQDRHERRDERRDRREDRRNNRKSSRYENGFRRTDVHCTDDWQMLWNGCHVRRELDRIAVYERKGDRLVWGEDVYLLRNGYYKVRSGGFWRIFDDDGDRIDNLWGDSVELLPNGLFRCVRAGIVHFYNRKGKEEK